jgi:MFS family permease
MAPPKGGSLLSILSEPFRDANFRKLLVFTGSWGFAINLAAPFFTVYLLKRLGQSMSWVIALTVLSQFVNVAFLRIWGRLADRFTNKSVLTVSGPLFIVSILLWPFTTMPDIYFLTFPLLVAIHVLSGMSAAGVTLCTGNIALKAAPKGTATAYLATNALVAGLSASMAPILGGLAADWFETQELSITVRWASTAPESLREFLLPALNLRGLDFLFICAVIFGFYALHRLLAVKEEGEVEDDVVVTELYAEVRKTARHVSTVTGLRYLTEFPYAVLKDMPRPGRWKIGSNNDKADREEQT